MNYYGNTTYRLTAHGLETECIFKIELYHLGWHCQRFT